MVRRDEAVGMATVSEVSLPPLLRWEKPVVCVRSLGFGDDRLAAGLGVWETPVFQFMLNVSANTR